MTIFSVTANELQRLNSDELEELVGRLCEAELERQHRSRTSVYWSGSTKASDGGVDVMVNAQGGEFKPGFVPNRLTVFQCKIPSMPPSEIRREMTKAGAPLEIFQRLCGESGVYIIVSLADDPTQKMLDERLNAMKEVVQTIPDSDQITMNFYGATKLARWLDCHPTVQIWVRQRLGLELTGWQAFGRWARTPDSDSDEFIGGTGVQISIGATPENDPNNEDVIAGLNRLRGHLNSTTKAVRIVGLSGVGKTRLVQALFEKEMGENCLNPNSAIYVDIGEELNPSARELLSSLIVGRHKAVMVVDNCSPDMHRNLASIHQSHTGHDVRLITIEYDVKDDKPEHTDVVRINTIGTEICTRLLKRRFPNLSETEAERIADLADGNTRLGIVIADAVGERDSVSSLDDSELFRRLFRQRNDTDPTNLEASAEVFSLVYSFSTDDSEQGVNELSVLAELIGQNRDTLFRNSVLLQDRQIIQARGAWRAILPHVIANRLAKQALQRIGHNKIKEFFATVGSPRLIESFARRIGYLHDSLEAKKFIDGWLTQENFPRGLSPISGLGLKIVRLLAPANQGAVLRIFQHYADAADQEWFLSRYKNSNYSTICHLLVNLAYEERYFLQATRLLVEFAKREKADENYDSILNRLKSLFQLRLSGTHASTATRTNVVRELIESSDPADQAIGFQLLKRGLKNSNFSNYSPEFGGHVRDFGFQVSVWGDIFNWYEAFFKIASDVLHGSSTVGHESVAQILKTQFSELWGLANLQPSLIALIERLIELDLIADMLSSLNRTYYYTYANPDRHDGGLGDEGKEALENLIRECQPQSLTAEIRTYLLSRSYFEHEELESFDSKKDTTSLENVYDAARKRAIKLGKLAADSIDALDNLWPDFFQDGGAHLYSFGVGLAVASASKENLTRLLFDKIDQFGESVRNTSLVAGVLSNIQNSNPEKLEAILKDAFNRPACRDWMGFWLTVLPDCPSAYSWLLRLVDQQIKYTHFFDRFIWCPELRLTNEQKWSFINLLLAMDGGDLIVIEGLAGCLRDEHQTEFVASDRTRELAFRAVLSVIRTMDFQSSDTMTSYYVEKVIEGCLSNDIMTDNGNSVVVALFNRMREEFGIRFGVRRIFRMLAQLYSQAFLDHLHLIWTEHTADNSDGRRHQICIDVHDDDILRLISPDDLKIWIEQGPVQPRCEFLAQFVQPLPTDDHGDLSLRDNSIALIEMSSEAAPIIHHFAQALRPTGWSGNLSMHIKKRREAFEVLLEHQREDVREAAKELIGKARTMEDQEKQNEQAIEKDEQRFE